jgi:hypothetical protein
VATDRSTFARACPARVWPEFNVGTGDMLDRNRSIVSEAVMIFKTTKPLYLLVSLATIMPFLGPGSALAVVCDGSVPKQPPVHLYRGEQTGWAFYCHSGTYYYGSFAGYTGVYSIEVGTLDPRCIIATPNILLENKFKFDAEFFNWCGQAVDMVVTIACSSVDPTPP